jgi:tRNA dimethylallyltransferase
VGPTASGKSTVALEVAKAFGGHIVSVDSMQVYRGMDIGTAKATATMRQAVTHHLLDLVEPEHDHSVAEYQREGRAVLAELAAADTKTVICGGSGLHFRSLVDPLEFPPNDVVVRQDLERLDPEVARARLVELDADAATHVDMNNPRRVVRALEVAMITGHTPSRRAQTEAAEAVRSYRPVVDFVAIGLDPGDGLPFRVERRFDQMLADGLVDEVRRLQPRLGRMAAQAVGYKELLPVIAGERELEDGRAAAIRATMALAKRQRTFFRRDPRIHWISWDPDPQVRLETALEYLDGAMR